jgi:hypothetical protein
MSLGGMLWVLPQSISRTEGSMLLSEALKGMAPAKFIVPPD